MDLLVLLLFLILCMVIIPGVPAFFISRVVRKQLEIKGNRNARPIRTVVFLVIFGLILTAEIIFMYYNFRLER